MKRLFAGITSIMFVTVLLLCACRGGGKNSGKNSQGKNQEISSYNEGKPVGPVVIHIDDNVTPLYDTLCVDNLIESYKYVPLASVPGSMVMGGCPMKVAGRYLLVGGMLFRPDFKVFKDDGQYEGNAVLYGRGPNEITNVDKYFVDYARHELVIISTEKMLLYNFETQKTRTVRSGINAQYSGYARLGNGDFVLLPFNDYTDEGVAVDAYRPALIFYDSLFHKSDTVFRYAPKHRRFMDEDFSPTLGKVLRPGANGTLYQDMAGDTVFRIGADRKLIPEFVIDIPEKLKMTVSDSETGSAEVKEHKVVIKHYEVSKDYICLSYHHDGVGRFGIWSKKTGQLLFRYVHPYDRHFMKVLLDGKVLEVPIGEFLPGSNSFVSSAPAAQMKHAIPSLKDDDNPVAIEITLKPAE